MSFAANPAAPTPGERPADPRFPQMFVAGASQADILIAGVPYDASVLGRKGAKGGPQGIREAWRFLANHDPAGHAIGHLALHDAGDVQGLDTGDDVLAAHAAVRTAMQSLFAQDKPVLIMGGDHGLTYPHVQALADQVEGSIGIVVIDAHYDLRDYEGQPSSGTPFHRILTELEGRVKPDDVVEIGIRPYANTQGLADYAHELGIHVHTMAQVRSRGIQAVIEETMAALQDVDHLWISVDIDGLDQSIASGCSAPGPGGLWFDEAAAIVEAVAGDRRCRGMDILEVAPSLDPTGNTCRSAAGLMAHFCGALSRNTGA